MNWKRWALELCRVVLGSTFVLSGVLKAIDPVGVSLKISEYLLSILGSQWGWLVHVAMALAVALCIVEFILGAFLLMGVYRRLTARLSFIMMLGMTILTTYIYVTDTVNDCGCFGDMIRLTNWESLIKNFILLPMSYYVMVGARQMAHLYTRRERWLPALLAVVGITQFTISNGYYLPYIDVRPYKIGFNLNEKIQEADSTYQAELLQGTKYLYRRGEEVAEFSIDNLPNSTWVFEKQIQSTDLKSRKLVYTFEVQTDEGEQIEQEILQDSVGTFLLMSVNWANANQEHLDEINELHKYAEAKGYKFYGVSASTPEEEAEWCYQTGADYPIHFMDATTIKTIVRANPGLMLLKNGVIVDKLSVSMLPEVERIPEFVHSRMVLGQSSKPSVARAVLLAVWAIVLVLGVLRLLLRRTYLSIHVNKRQSEGDEINDIIEQSK